MVCEVRRCSAITERGAGAFQSGRISRVEAFYELMECGLESGMGVVRVGPNEVDDFAVLHSARFRRKPRGGPAGLGEAYDQRLSFCCASDLCRKRMTPPSFRFFGRKVYLGAVVVLVSAMRQGATAARQLCALVGVG